MQESQDHFNLAKSKLEEAKQFVRLFGLDYDGTVYDGADYKTPQVFALVEKILSRNKSVAFITARAATALKMLASPLQELLARRETATPVFIAGGNGAVLHEVKQGGLIEIYNHGLALPQIARAVEAGKAVYEKLGISVLNLSEKGLETFKKFLQEDWEEYVPKEIVDICRPFQGEIFTEQAKVTFVLPKDRSLHEKLITELNKELGEECQAAAGDDVYVHITRKFNEDSKTMAIKTVLQGLGLKQDQVATFGDMPTGNDIGLLSFPYSFTNSEKFVKIKNNLKQPPYILNDSGLAPVARVYEAINYLLS